MGLQGGIDFIRFDSFKKKKKKHIEWVLTQTLSLESQLPLSGSVSSCRGFCVDEVWINFILV